MPTNLTSQKNIIVILVAVLLLLGGVYYFLISPSETDSLSGSKAINKGLLNKKVTAFLDAKDRIDLKDSSFLKSVYYSELEDKSEDIGMTTKRGRDNPFIPYVAPRSIR